MIDQLLKIMAFMYRDQLILTCLFPIRQQTVVCTHHSGKEPESEYPLAVFMYQAFIVDQGNIALQNGLQHMFVVWLLLTCVGKEQVFFPG
jgi:hypothetical protein